MNRVVWPGLARADGGERTGCTLDKGERGRWLVRAHHFVVTYVQPINDARAVDPMSEAGLAGVSALLDDVLALTSWRTVSRRDLLGGLAARALVRDVWGDIEADEVPCGFYLTGSANVCGVPVQVNSLLPMLMELRDVADEVRVAPIVSGSLRAKHGAHLGPDAPLALALSSIEGDCLAVLMRSRDDGREVLP